MEDWFLPCRGGRGSSNRSCCFRLWKEGRHHRSAVLSNRRCSRRYCVPSSILLRSHGEKARELCTGEAKKCPFVTVEIMTSTRIITFVVAALMVSAQTVSAHGVSPLCPPESFNGFGQPVNTRIAH